jgi:hypothetical protein
VLICVKNYIRPSPPVIMAPAEVEDVIGRLGAAIARAKSGRPTGTDFSASRSLAASAAACKTD